MKIRRDSLAGPVIYSGVVQHVQPGYARVRVSPAALLTALDDEAVYTVIITITNNGSDGNLGDEVVIDDLEPLTEDQTQAGKKATKTGRKATDKVNAKTGKKTATKKATAKTAAPKKAATKKKATAKKKVNRKK